MASFQCATTAKNALIIDIQIIYVLLYLVVFFFNI